MIALYRFWPEVRDSALAVAETSPRSRSPDIAVPVRTIVKTLGAYDLAVAIDPPLDVEAAGARTLDIAYSMADGKLYRAMTHPELYWCRTRGARSRRSPRSLPGS